MEGSPPASPRPQVPLFSFLRENHRAVLTYAIRDVPSLCKADKKEVAKFIVVNCTVPDRGHLNLSSMSLLELRRYAAAILVPHHDKLPGALLICLTPYVNCAAQELLLLAERMGRLPTKRSLLKTNVVLFLVASSSKGHQPVFLSIASERCRRLVTERCLLALAETFDCARSEEECRRFLDWTRRDALAHKTPGLLLDRVQWLQQIGLRPANDAARYLLRHILPFLLMRPDLILSDHGSWEALQIDLALRHVLLVSDNPNSKNDQDNTNDSDESDSEEEQIEERRAHTGEERDGGFFQRLPYPDETPLREPQRLALEALRKSVPDFTHAPTEEGAEYQTLVELRLWFSRVLHATFSEREPPLEDGERLFVALSALRDKRRQLSPPPRMVVLPTGVGKTAVICLAPFTTMPVARRVLVVCPNVVIREQLANSFTTFYEERMSMKESPKVVEIDATWDFTQETTQCCDIHVATFHSFKGNELLARFPRSFFDLVLVDEAHHAEAFSYRLLREHFSKAQFIYFTGTPYRSDHIPLHAQLVYSCTMKEALLRPDPYIKHLCYLPLPVRTLTLRSSLLSEERKFHSFEDVVEHADEIGNLRLSLEARAHVIGFAIWKLKRMRLISGVLHQAILQASDTSEAAFLTSLWDSHPENTERFSIASIHCGMPREDIHSIVKRLKTNQLDAIVHVGMIGEGFDHPQLSLCCIFKGYASMPPIVQLFGRILRRITGVGDADNCGYIIAHPALGLHKHWEMYKQEDELPDDSELKKHATRASALDWTDLEETYCYDDEEKHANWFLEKMKTTK